MQLWKRIEDTHLNSLCNHGLYKDSIEKHIGMHTKDKADHCVLPLLLPHDEHNDDDHLSSLSPPPPPTLSLWKPLMSRVL
jgi:hypothetical protein